MNRMWVFSLCAITIAFAAFADRKVTSLSGTGWTLDGEPVSVPHTWNAVDGCDGGVNPPKTFTSCRASSYVRKAATYARALPDPTLGKRQFVKCDAVSIKATVRVNGREVGRHRGAFTAFCFEVTDFLKPAGNQLEIIADNTLDEDIPPIVGDFTMYRILKTRPGRFEIKMGNPIEKQAARNERAGGLNRYCESRAMAAGM